MENPQTESTEDRKLRLEINMHFGTEPIKIAAGTGLVQVVFHRLEEATESPYVGKYQDQTKNQDAIMDSVHV